MIPPRIQTPRFSSIVNSLRSLGASVIGLAIGLVACITPAYAQREDARPSAVEESVLRRDANFLLLSMAEDLAAEDTARSLALAARLRTMALEAEAYATGGQPPFDIVDAKTARWLEHSERLNADDPVAIALILPLLRTTDPQRHADAVRRWRDAEPDNLAPLLHADLSDTELLATARGTFRADDHFTTILRLTAQAVLRPRTGPVASIMERVVVSAGPGNRETYAASLGSMVAARGVPQYTPLARVCRTPGDTLRLQCRHVGEVMSARADTMLGRMIGHALLRDSAIDDTQRAQAQALRLRLDWLSARNAEASGRDLSDHSTRFVRALLDGTSAPSENDILERLLQESGVPLEPPADWNRERDPALQPKR